LAQRVLEVQDVARADAALLKLGCHAGGARAHQRAAGEFVATIFSGATPSSTHLMTALTPWCSASRYALGGSGAPPPIELGPVWCWWWARRIPSRKRLRMVELHKQPMVLLPAHFATRGMLDA
jgi:hypothetical protein